MSILIDSLVLAGVTGKSQAVLGRDTGQGVGFVAAGTSATSQLGGCQTWKLQAQPGSRRRYREAAGVTGKSQAVLGRDTGAFSMHKKHEGDEKDRFS